MDLTFLGRGSAFNPKEGNTAAYFIENKELFLIDCGSSIYEEIIEEDLLDNINCINIMITHRHGDHCGSISTLIERCFFRINDKIKVNIILPKNIKYIENITTLLTSLEINKNMYYLTSEEEYDNKYSTFQNIRYIRTKHCQDILSYGLIFNTKEGIIYYSGDTNDKHLIQEIITKYNNRIDKLYIDTTNEDYPGNVHMYLGILEEIIPETYKSKVNCMHINNDQCIEDIQRSGFQVVKTKRKHK